MNIEKFLRKVDDTFWKLLIKICLKQETIHVLLLLILHEDEGKGPESLSRSPSLACPIASWKDRKCALGPVSHRKIRFWFYQDLRSFALPPTVSLFKRLVVALCIWDLMTLIYVIVLTRESQRSSYLLWVDFQAFMSTLQWFLLLFDKFFLFLL